MQAFRCAIAAVAVGVSVSAAQAIEVHRWAIVEGTPDLIWLGIGDFCEIEDWHPAVAECDEHDEEDVEYRTLTLADGGAIEERLTEDGDNTYSYEIISGPLPVRNYRATFRVSEAEGGTRIDWWAHFDAAGVSNATARGIIAGIFEAGLDEIVRQEGTWP
jgi:hypothetical protein